jgi:hypothetical protein
VTYNWNKFICVCQWLMARSVVFPGYSGFLSQYNWLGWHRWNIVTPMIQNPNNYIIKYVTSSEIVILMNKMFTKIYTNEFLIFKWSKWHLLIKILFSSIWKHFVKKFESVTYIFSIFVVNSCMWFFLILKSFLHIRSFIFCFWFR